MEGLKGRKRRVEKTHGVKEEKGDIWGGREKICKMYTDSVFHLFA